MSRRSRSSSRMVYPAGEVVTTIATDDHTQALDQRLRVSGIDPADVRATGRLLSLDAHETLAKFMRDGEPDPRLFEAVIGDVMAERAAVANGAESACLRRDGGRALEAR